METLLSICIPTYNRAHYLQEAILAIIPQASMFSIPIYVLDNASLDNTKDVVDKLKQAYNMIFYSNQSENVGLDRNMLDVIKLSSSEYCWWLGDDDIVEPDALIKVIEILKKEPQSDLLLLNAINVSADLQKRSNKKLINITDNKLYSNVVDFFNDHAANMPFGNLIVHRKQILNTENSSRFIGTSHAYSGAILDYLAYKQVVNGAVKIVITAVVMVALRDGIKSWAHQYAVIHFIHIPAWNKSLLPIYQPIAKGQLKQYFKNILSYKNLLSFRIKGMLNNSNYADFGQFIPKHYMVRMKIMTKLPYKLAVLLYWCFKVPYKIYRVLRG